jgi:hypothetical protein
MQTFSRLQMIQVCCFLTPEVTFLVIEVRVLSYQNDGSDFVDVTIHGATLPLQSELMLR